MRIAILGATSQIAGDLILGLAGKPGYEFYLYARRIAELEFWLSQNGLLGRCQIHGYAGFAEEKFDAVINFVGAGDPAQIAALGNSIFDVTLQFDEMVLRYLKSHPRCRYFFLSSGAVYGSSFDKPAEQSTAATIRINGTYHHEWYGVAKLHAECRHRAHVDSPIIDIRVFNYFSRTQNINARFLITDMLRAIRDKTVFKTSSDYIVRDYLHPSDFCSLIKVLLSAPEANTAVDCYSKAPVDKPALLAAMRSEFGLRHETSQTHAALNATGAKTHYYSNNRRAAEFGYEPQLTSLEGILTEAAALLGIGMPMAGKS